MNTDTTQPKAAGRIWFIAGGAFSLAFGAMAITIPCVTTVVLAKMVGYFLLAGGVVLLATGLFGKTRKHRLLDVVTGILRMVVGIVFIGNLVKTVLVLTLFLAAMFAIEGLIGIFLALKLRGKHPAWGWVLFNSLAALALGLMLFARFPSDAPWVIGLLFGINSIFLGVSLIMYGLGLKQARDA